MYVYDLHLHTGKLCRIQRISELSLDLNSRRKHRLCPLLIGRNIFFHQVDNFSLLVNHPAMNFLLNVSTFVEKIFRAH